MKINKKDGSNKNIELTFINKDEYDEFLKILNSNILHLNKNKNFNLSSEKRMIKIFESANMTNNTIIVNIGEELFFDLFFIMFNSMFIIKKLEKVNNIQKEYIRFLKFEEKKELEKLIEENKKS